MLSKRIGCVSHGLTAVLVIQWRAASFLLHKMNHFPDKIHGNTSKSRLQRARTQEEVSGNPGGVQHVRTQLYELTVQESNPCDLRA